MDIKAGEVFTSKHGVPCLVVTLARDSETLGVSVVFTSGTGLYWVMTEDDFENGPRVATASPGEFTALLGKYMHFKGNPYQVVCRARDPGTLANLIVYENPDGQRWVRPEAMFLEEVTWPDGVLRPRFVPAVD